MTDQEKNQIIHEAMGLCWHKWENPCKEGYEIISSCLKCGKSSLLHKNPDYSKWEHYGPMLEWAMEQEWWPRLVVEWMMGSVHTIAHEIEGRPWLNYHIPQQYLNPLRGSTAIVEFLKERKDAK